MPCCCQRSDQVHQFGGRAVEDQCIRARVGDAGERDEHVGVDLEVGAAGRVTSSRIDRSESSSWGVMNTRSALRAANS